MVAQMYFGKRAFTEAKAIDTQISYDKEHIAQLEARTSCLPFVWATHLLEALSHMRSFLLFLVLLGTIYGLVTILWFSVGCNGQILYVCFVYEKLKYLICTSHFLLQKVVTKFVLLPSVLAWSGRT